MPAAKRMTDAVTQLAAHGLVPGPDGFDRADLEALAESRGWSISLEPVIVTQRRTRWRAVVLDHTRTPHRIHTTSGRATSAHGATEAAALTVALGSMLRRHDR